MRRQSDRIFALAALGAVCSYLAPAAAAGSPEAEETVVLAVVNGDSVSTADLDELLIDTHRGMSTNRRAAFDYRKLLDQLINDRLLRQQAEQLGLDQEPAILEPVEKGRIDDAVQKYVKAVYEGPEKIGDEAVRDFFDEYYWKIQLRQVSLLDEAVAKDLRAAIRQGASMDSIARAVSVDTHRYRGGLHNLKVWADVVNELRDASRELEVGELSEIFRYRDAFAFVKVEERLTVDEADLPVYEDEIRKYLRGAERERSWAAFIDEHFERIPLTVYEDVVARIVADSADVISKEFVVRSDDPVLSAGEIHVTEFELRKSLSHKAMQASQAPFDSLVTAAIDAERSDLVLHAAAEAGGWLEDEGVLERYREELDQALIEAYLSEVIVPDIKFNREEFREYWEQHPEMFREPPEVQLGTIMVGTREEADEIMARLHDGADFGYLRTQYARPGHDAIETDKWVSPAIFSGEIRDDLLRLEVGQSSGPFEVAGGWFVFKLKNRRAGDVKPLDECELRLREIMFQNKFNALLDEHLALLKERSDLVLHEAAIEEYFGPKS